VVMQRIANPSRFNLRA